MEEKGYTLPEYAFTVECDGVESEESGQLDVMGWIKKQIIINNLNLVLSDYPYMIKFPDGAIKEGKTDSNGWIDISNIKYKNYKLKI